MIPRIKFHFSPIYNTFFDRFVKFSNTKDKYPAKERILSEMHSTEKEWGKIDKTILKSLIKYTGLKWREKEIICYFTGKCIPFSDPLTICYRKNKKDSLNLLIHELIHRLVFQNREDEGMKKIWLSLEEHFKKEDRLTINHIIVHAIHSKIYLDHFSEKERNANIIRDEKNIYYFKSWQIVNKIGFDKLLFLIKNRKKLSMEEIDSIINLCQTAKRR